jgi:phosphatidate cytidylyltransferase
VPERPRDALTLRVISALILAPVAIAIAYQGGWPFAVFWALAALGIWWEWSAMLSTGRSARALGLAALVLAGALAAALASWPLAGFAVVLGAVAVAAAAGRAAPAWAGAGVVYAGIVLVAPVALRADAGYGFAAMLLLYAVVWATDIFGYFVGRLVGGPKLWPRLSPKKTWSGAVGGAAGAVLAAVAVARYAYGANMVAICGLALLLSAVSQAGDLFESGIKRRFGVKDAGRLIPGHGGIMDRLDGFLAAALVAAVIGIVRGGLAAPARGLLVW